MLQGEGTRVRKAPCEGPMQRINIGCLGSVARDESDIDVLGRPRLAPTQHSQAADDALFPAGLAAALLDLDGCVYERIQMVPEPRAREKRACCSTKPECALRLGLGVSVADRSSMVRTAVAASWP